MSVEPKQAPQPSGLPNGYREGIILAITVFLGFSLLFLRFWALEAPGHWTNLGRLAAALMVAAILFFALWRALQVADDDPREYAITLRWFLWSVIVAVTSLVFAVVVPGGE